MKPLIDPHLLAYPTRQDTARLATLRIVFFKAEQQLLQTVPDCTERAIAQQRLNEALLWAQSAVKPNKPAD